MRLGSVHAVLLSHANGDHVGDRKLAALNAGSYARPETVPAAPQYRRLLNATGTCRNYPAARAPAR